MNKTRKTTTLTAFLSALMALQLAGCGSQAPDNSNEKTLPEDNFTEISDEETVISDEESNTSEEAVGSEKTDHAEIYSEYSVEYSKKELLSTWDDDVTKITADKNKFSIEGSGAAAENGVLKITDAGTYLLSGKAEEAQILIDSADDKAVRLVFSGFSVSSSSVSPVYVQNADKVIITLADGTENSVTDNSPAVPAEDNETPDAALFSRSDLSFNGSGKLSVVSENKEGITSKDDLKVISGCIYVRSADDGIKGKDLVAVRSGEISIESSGDGIKSSNDKDADKGNIIIENGKISIDSAGDGIQAEKALVFLDGQLSVKSGGGYENGAEHFDDMFGGPGGFGSRQGGMQQSSENGSSISRKGMKSGGELLIASGNILINSADDALHSGTDLRIEGGELALGSGDDGINADNEIIINGGNTVISNSYEGAESKLITINDGTLCIKSSDDGMNASADDMSAQMKITINGGYVYVDADGDGLDSNGDIDINGGYTIVSGPVSNFNGPLDCGDRNNRITVNGGILAAFGSSGMFEIPDASSEINSVAVSQLNVQPGTLCTLADSSGNVVLAFTCSKTAQAAVISSPDIKTGEKYVFCTGGTYTGTLGKDGTGCGGTVSGGTRAAEFEIGSSVTVSGQFSGGFGGGAGMKGNRGDRFGGQVTKDGNVPDGWTPSGGMNGEGFHNGKGSRGDFSAEDIPDGWQPHNSPDGRNVPDGTAVIDGTDKKGNTLS